MLFPEQRRSTCKLTTVVHSEMHLVLSFEIFSSVSARFLMKCPENGKQHIFTRMHTRKTVLSVVLPADVPPRKGVGVECCGAFPRAECSKIEMPGENQEQGSEAAATAVTAMVIVEEKNVVPPPCSPTSPTRPGISESNRVAATSSEDGATSHAFAAADNKRANDNDHNDDEANHKHSLSSREERERTVNWLFMEKQAAHARCRELEKELAQSRDTCARQEAR